MERRWKRAQNEFGKVKQCHCERVKVLFTQLCPFVTPSTVALKAPLSTEFSRQEYWSGFQSLLQGIFPTQGSNLGLFSCIAGGFFTVGATREDIVVTKLREECVCVLRGSMCFWHDKRIEMSGSVYFSLWAVDVVAGYGSISKVIYSLA